MPHYTSVQRCKPSTCLNLHQCLRINVCICIEYPNRMRKPTRLFITNSNHLLSLSPDRLTQNLNSNTTPSHRPKAPLPLPAGSVAYGPQQRTTFQPLTAPLAEIAAARPPPTPTTPLTPHTPASPDQPRPQRASSQLPTLSRRVLTPRFRLWAPLRAPFAQLHAPALMACWTVP